MSDWQVLGLVCAVYFGGALLAALIMGVAQLKVPTAGIDTLAPVVVAFWPLFMSLVVIGAPVYAAWRLGMRLAK